MLISNLYEIVLRVTNDTIINLHVLHYYSDYILMCEALTDMRI